MGRVRNKKIWLYFDKISEYSARCRNCKLNLSCKYTSANLVRHLYYKHHVDASYYGAERTGFLKQKRARTNQRSEVELDAAPPCLTPVVATADSYDPLAAIKEEAPLDIARCNRSEGGDEDTQSAHEFHKSTRSLSPAPHPTSCIEEGIAHRNADDMLSLNSNLQNADNANMCIENPHLKEKLKAEARYYNEMAELARAKRIMVELQSKKLMLEMETMRSS